MPEVIYNGTKHAIAEQIKMQRAKLSELQIMIETEVLTLELLESEYHQLLVNGEHV